MRNLLLRYPKKKSAWIDEIPTIIYCELADLLAKPLALIFNQSCKQRAFPEAWKTGLIVPIPKTNPPDIKKLRYITLLPLPSKLLERIVFNNLKNLFYKAYGPEQHGFRQDASTTSALLQLINSALKLYDDSSNPGPAMIYLVHSTVLIIWLPWIIFSKRASLKALLYGFEVISAIEPA